MSREKRIEQWLSDADGTFNHDARPGGVGLAGLENISRWLSTQPETPMVSMAWVTPDSIHLFFAQETSLVGVPWKEGADASEWIINARDALQLPTGSSFASQMSALTGLGDTPDGCKVLYNLTRMQRIGANGTSELSHGFIIGMVMEMAGQAWTAEHDIWLIGHGELGEKIINFLAPFHQNMYSAEKISEVPTAALQGRSATLFVMGSTEGDLAAFGRVATAGTSIVTDTIPGNEVTLAVDIRTNTTAQVLPLDYEIFPVMVTTEDEVYLAMDAQWVARENLLQDFNDTEFTVNDIISAPNTEQGNESDGANQRNVSRWCRQLTGYGPTEAIQNVADAITTNSQVLSRDEREQVRAALGIALARAVEDSDVDTAQSILDAQDALSEGDTQ
jgi:hypothetical protein